MFGCVVSWVLGESSPSNHLCGETMSTEDFSIVSVVLWYVLMWICFNIIWLSTTSDIFYFSLYTSYGPPEYTYDKLCRIFHSTIDQHFVCKELEGQHTGPGFIMVQIQVPYVQWRMLLYGCALRLQGCWWCLWWWLRRDVDKRGPYPSLYGMGVGFTRSNWFSLFVQVNLIGSE